MTVILIMYILIGIKLNKSNPVSSDRSNAAVVKARKAVIKMLGRFLLFAKHNDCSTSASLKTLFCVQFPKKPK